MSRIFCEVCDRWFETYLEYLRFFSENHTHC
jgi:hypothetical protein